MSETLIRQDVKVREKIIDADVHPWIDGDIKGLKPYLSRDWWAHFDGRYVLPNHWLRPPLARASSNRIDAITPSGGEPGSDPVFMRQVHLDKHDISHAVLSSIGVGRMGGLMAARLIDAGHALIVFDANDLAVAPLVQAGATRAGTLAELAGQSEIVFASLPTPEIVRQAALGSGGIVESATTKLFVDLSTTGSRVARIVVEGLASKGIIAVDCPVSGGLAGARKGTLALMVSCPATAYDQLRDFLTVFGKPIFVSELPGAAQTMKLANNLLAAGAIAISSEAFVFGVKGDLDPKTMCEVFNASSGRNTATTDKFPRSVLSGTFDFGFSTALACKDVRLCLDEAEALGVSTPVGSAVRQLLGITQAMFGPDSDFTSMVRPLEQWAGVEVRSPGGSLNEAEGG